MNDDLVSYFNRLVNDVEMPELIWKLNEDYLEATIDYDGDYNVSLWVAENSDGRDFRLWMEGELWIQSPIKKSKDGNYRVEIKARKINTKLLCLSSLLIQILDFVNYFNWTLCCSRNISISKHVKKT